MRKLVITTIAMFGAIMLFLLGAWNGSGFLILTMCPGALAMIWLHGFMVHASGIRISLDTTPQPAMPTASQRPQRPRPQSVSEKISEFS